MLLGVTAGAGKVYEEREVASREVVMSVEWSPAGAIGSGTRRDETRGLREGEEGRVGYRASERERSE